MDKIFRFDTYDKKHLKNLQERARIIDQLFNAVAERGVKLGLASGFKDSDKPFYFSDFPAIKKRMDTEIEKFSSNIKTVIEDGNTEEWLLSCRKNDAMVDMLHSSTNISKQRLEQLKQPNLSALEAFQSRKSAGMNLSDRVWRLGEQFKGELELALDVGLSEGRSAAEMSNDVRRYLREPDRLFRRVRDKHGVLRLSKSAQNYNPGRGVYRSSYKNAIRLTGTENNIAYRTADHLRWQQLDFVIGIEVKLSNNHTLNGRPFFDICDELAGVYPKEFKFTGWHPKCRCFAVPILADMDEFIEREQPYVDGEDVSGIKYKGEVKDVPENFKTWIEDNQERIERAKSKPYFIADNGKYIDRIVSEKIKQRNTALTLDDLKNKFGYELPATLKELDYAISKFHNYDDTFVANADEINEVMRELIRNNDLGMDVEAANLESIFEKGFLNTFQTGTSKGYKGSTKTTGDIETNHARLVMSHKMFAPKSFNTANSWEYTGKQLERGEYEKYGHMLDRDKHASITRGLTHYGDTQVRFKKDNVLCTWTFDDSLRSAGDYCQPSLTTDPKVSSFDRICSKMPKKTDNISLFEDWRRDKGTSYIELQYHGKLTIDDVESITFQSEPTNWVKQELLDKLKAKNIEIWYKDYFGKMLQY